MGEDIDAPGYLHVTPINDLREHQDHSGCWRRPEIYHQDSVVVHNSMTGAKNMNAGGCHHDRSS